MEKEVYIEGKKISYEQESPEQQKNIIFIHGSGATKQTWKHQLKATLPNYTKIAIDLIGHGNSQGNGYSSIDDYVEFIKSFIEALNLKNVTLCGHSMGGAIVLLFSLKYPQLIDKIIIAGSGAKLKVHQDILKATLEGANYAVDWAYCEHTKKELIEEAESEFNNTNKIVRYNDFLACNEFDIMQKVNQIDKPALVIVGSCDKLTPIKYAQYLKDNIKHSQMVIIQNAGHMSMWEKPDDFNKAICNFLQ
ncbi:MULTISPECIES: alpha/beta fold hydrolase [Desulfurella]|uniref:alpha/beta fold hydrolase n=1 Tax=Desulfurella TaxID=33001 RepID=UPI000CBC8A9D|nr:MULTISPECIES: alpha/beta hydrolase [Desulfurella]PMP67718.1 MAG: alpha/beta hydrolase [Desulfurella multipotens]PMP87330.1 MAG: alpha/beta hydrolase [Desulfurella sp.]